MKVYLCGAIHGCTDEEAMGWRELAKRLLKHETLDPMARDYRGRELENVAAIVEGDKADIDSCQALLVYYRNPSVGTSMEILWAWLNHTPVYLVGNGQRLSPWLIYHSRHVFNTLEEAIDALNGTAGSAGDDQAAAVRSR